MTQTSSYSSFSWLYTMYIAGFQFVWEICWTKPTCSLFCDDLIMNILNLHNETRKFRFTWKPIFVGIYFSLSCLPTFSFGIHYMIRYFKLFFYLPAFWSWGITLKYVLDYVCRPIPLNWKQKYQSSKKWTKSCRRNRCEFYFKTPERPYKSLTSSFLSANFLTTRFVDAGWIYWDAERPGTGLYYTS